MTKAPETDPAERPPDADDARREAPMSAEAVEAMAARLDVLNDQVFERLRRPLSMAEIEARFDAMLDQLGLEPGD